MTAPLIAAPGAYPGIAAEDYHRNPNLLPGPSLSGTGAKTLVAKSPAHFWYNSPLNPKRPPEEDKRHLNIGKAAHDRLLLADRWETHYFILPPQFDPRATVKQAEWHAEAAAAREAGKVILRSVDADTVDAVVDAVQNNELASALLTNGESELTLAWQHKETGVWLRARPDFLPTARQIISDLKFMADGSRNAFSRAISANGYAISAAMICDGVAAVFGDKVPPHWMHIVVEKEAPHVVALWELPLEDINRGRWLYHRAVRLFAECLNRDRWPGYADTPERCGLPEWDQRKIDGGSWNDGITVHAEAPQ